MQLERLALALRPRSPWEAMDLGFAMAREWWRPIWTTWLAAYVPIALILHVVWRENPLWAAVCLWWLKPAFDRVVLHVLGRAVFGEAPGVRDTMRSLKTAFTPGLVASLTLYRFDLARSFNLPVWQLERAKGAAARSRARVLHRRARGHAVWLTFICLHFELILALSLMMLMDMLTPGSGHSGVGWFSIFRGDRAPPELQDWFNNLYYLLAMSLIEPFYVAAGFALYLNRRTQLEAWDIELALHRLNQRAAQPLGAPTAAAFLLAFVLAMCHTPAPAIAADAQAKSAGVEIAEVLKEPEFNRYKEVTVWRYTGRGLGLDESENKSKPGQDWSSLGLFLAQLARAVLWIGAVLLVLWVLRLAVHYARQWYAQREESYRPPDALFGFDIRPESLPDDVAAAALALCAQQRMREALSLLYRGALSQLVHRRHLDLRAGDTEEDCLRRVRAQGEASSAGYFARLVDTWQQAAYGGRIPQQAAAEQLCHGWRQHFAATAVS